MSEMGLPIIMQFCFDDLVVNKIGFMTSENCLILFLVTFFHNVSTFSGTGVAHDNPVVEPGFIGKRCTEAK